jgi:PAS domain S-box-containing protein
MEGRDISLAQGQPTIANPTTQRVRVIALTVLVGIAYFVAARLSLLLMTPPGVAVFWPAAGVSSGILIALGRTARWPVAVGVVAATLAANLTGDRHILSSSIFALSDAGEALLVAWIVEPDSDPDFRCDRLRHVLALLAAAIVGTAVSGIGGTIGYKLGYNPDDPAWTVWRQWVASDAIGIIAIAPLVIGVAEIFRAPPSPRELVEGAVALIAVAAATALIIFMLPPNWWEMSVAVVLLFPVMLWVAARCRPAIVAAAVSIVSTIVMATVTFKLGNFGSAAPSMDDSIVAAQVTIVGTALSALILSALFTERRQHEAILAASEIRLQDALAVGAALTFDLDLRTGQVVRSDNAGQILGYEPQQQVDAKSFLGRVDPDDLKRMTALLSTLSRDNPTYSIAYRFRRFDGPEIWLQATAKAEFDPAGRVAQVKGMAVDITERRRAEEHQKLLIAELDHRVKNVLARVLAVVDSTRQRGGSVDEFIRSYKGRIQSLASIHTTLSQTGWRGADLTTLVNQQLAPYLAGANTTIAGPDIQLSPTAAQAFAMVLYELVTNAVKYGALSITGGQVTMSWERQLNGSASPTLSFVWREFGGPPVAAPTQRGYGTDLIRNLIPHELGGSVDLAFASDGACCKIAFPLEPVSAEQQAMPDRRDAL